MVKHGELKLTPKNMPQRCQVHLDCLPAPPDSVTFFPTDSVGADEMAQIVKLIQSQAPPDLALPERADAPEPDPDPELPVALTDLDEVPGAKWWLARPWIPLDVPGRNTVVESRGA